MKPVEITITRELPGDARYGDDPIHASSADKGELWPAWIEKAYAKWKGSYNAIDHGGQAALALAALTGSDVSVTPLSRYSGPDTVEHVTSPDEVFQKLRTALTQKKAITADTHRIEHDVAWDTSLVQGHVYSVLRVRQEGDQRFVYVRNPWGRGSRELTLEEFMRWFQFFDAAG